MYSPCLPSYSPSSSTISSIHSPSMHSPSILSSNSSSRATTTTLSSFKNNPSLRSVRTSSTLLSVKLLSHKLNGFYKLLSSITSDPVLSINASYHHFERSKSYDRMLTMSDLTRRCTIKKQHHCQKQDKKKKKEEKEEEDNDNDCITSTMSLRAMELEALINDYPDYTLHLTLTPRLCLEK